jgi:hypothetical protein
MTILFKGQILMRRELLSISLWVVVLVLLAEFLKNFLGVYGHVLVTGLMIAWFSATLYINLRDYAVLDY